MRPSHYQNLFPCINATPGFRDKSQKLFGVVEITRFWHLGLGGRLSTNSEHTLSLSCSDYTAHGDSNPFLLLLYARRKGVVGTLVNIIALPYK